MSWLWKIDKRNEQPCRSAGVPLADLPADVCSLRATRPALLLFVGSPVTSFAELIQPRPDHGS
jgi:hypothetical protein